MKFYCTFHYRAQIFDCPRYICSDRVSVIFYCVRDVRYCELSWVDVVYQISAYQTPTPSSSYSRTVTHHQQPINTTQQLSIFLNEIKTMFSQLIQQNGMILNMISTVIQKLTN